MYILLYTSLNHAAHLITDISITGNLKTPEYIISNQIKHPLDAEFNNTIALEDQNRIYNLDIFSYVQVGYDHSTYVVLVQEKKNITFQPLFKKIDGVGWSYGTKIFFNNIKGSTNQLGLSIGTGKINLGEMKYIYKSPFSNKAKLSISYKIDENQDIDEQYHIKKHIMSMAYEKKFNHFNLNMSIDNKSYKLNLNDNTSIDYLYITQGLKYNRIRNEKLISSKIAINFTNYLSSNNYSDFQSINFNYQYIKTLGDNNNSPRINMRAKMHITSNDEIPIFAMQYIGGDDFVRGYEAKTSLNPSEVIEKLKFNNYIFTSIQFEIPWFEINSYKTNILFFTDQAIGSNRYSSYDNTNRVVGYGFGYKITTKDNMQFDIHVGLNKYHNQVVHFMVKKNV